MNFTFDWWIKKKKITEIEIEGNMFNFDGTAYLINNIKSIGLNKNEDRISNIIVLLFILFFVGMAINKDIYHLASIAIGMLFISLFIFYINNRNTSYINIAFVDMSRLVIITKDKDFAKVLYEDLKQASQIKEVLGIRYKVLKVKRNHISSIIERVITN